MGEVLDEGAIVLRREPVTIDDEIAMPVDRRLDEIGEGYLVEHEEGPPLAQDVETEGERFLVQEGDRDVFLLQGRGNNADQLGTVRLRRPGGAA